MLFFPLLLCVTSVSPLPTKLAPVLALAYPAGASSDEPPVDLRSVFSPAFLPWHTIRNYPVPAEGPFFPFFFFLSLDALHPVLLVCIYP